MTQSLLTCFCLKNYNINDWLKQKQVILTLVLPLKLIFIIKSKCVAPFWEQRSSIWLDALNAQSKTLLRDMLSASKESSIFTNIHRVVLDVICSIQFVLFVDLLWGRVVPRFKLQIYHTLLLSL
jgi:hypothetical protein